MSKKQELLLYRDFLNWIDEYAEVYRLKKNTYSQSEDFRLFVY